MHFLLFLAVLYFLPALIASLRHSSSSGLIFLLNLLAGWTVVGWIVALVWALVSGPRVVYVYPATQEYRRY
jgi:hypothetical protein